MLSGIHWKVSSPHPSKSQNLHLVSYSCVDFVRLTVSDSTALHSERPFVPLFALSQVENPGSGVVLTVPVNSTNCFDSPLAIGHLSSAPARRSSRCSDSFHSSDPLFTGRHGKLRPNSILQDWSSRKTQCGRTGACKAL